MAVGTVKKSIETVFMPSNYSLGFHDDQSITPVAPDAGKQNPEKTVSTANLRPMYRLFHDGQLLAECKVFQNKIGGLFKSQKYVKKCLNFILIIDADFSEKVYNFNVKIAFVRDRSKS